MSRRAAIFLMVAAFGLASCAGPPGSSSGPATADAAKAPSDFGEVTMQAFDRHPNLRKVPEGAVQDSMFGCALSWRSDYTTPEAEMLINAAKAYDLMAAGDWEAIDPYCRLGALKKYLP